MSSTPGPSSTCSASAGPPSRRGPRSPVSTSLLKAARINRIVHLGNWLLSTNLHGGWRGEGVTAAREALAAAHPDHLLGIRSVDDWSSPGLREALAADGWILVPSRQIWVVDDLARDWTTRNDFGNDRRLVARSPLADLGPGRVGAERRPADRRALRHALRRQIFRAQPDPSLRLSSRPRPARG